MVDWGRTGSGATAGASAGFAVGGPWGAAIGGAGGALLGAAGSDTGENDMLLKYKDMINQRTLPEITADNTGQAVVSGFRNNQANLLARLEDTANGRGPSLAAEQMKAATDRNISQQAGIAQSGRGNATLANIVAANNIGALGAQASQQSMLGRIQEGQNANAQLLQGYQQARAQDEGLSQFNAQQRNFIAEANLSAKLKAMGLSDEAIQNIIRDQQIQAGIPTTSDRILAGATTAASLYATQQAQAKAAAAQGGGGGGYQPPARIDTTNPYA